MPHSAALFCTARDERRGYVRHRTGTARSSGRGSDASSPAPGRRATPPCSCDPRCPCCWPSPAPGRGATHGGSRTRDTGQGVRAGGNGAPKRDLWSPGGRLPGRDRVPIGQEAPPQRHAWRAGDTRCPRSMPQPSRAHALGHGYPGLAPGWYHALRRRAEGRRPGAHMIAGEGAGDRRGRAGRGGQAWASGGEHRPGRGQARVARGTRHGPPDGRSDSGTWTRGVRRDPTGPRPARPPTAALARGAGRRSGVAFRRPGRGNPGGAAPSPTAPTCSSSSPTTAP